MLAPTGETAVVKINENNCCKFLLWGKKKQLTRAKKNLNYVSLLGDSFPGTEQKASTS